VERVLRNALLSLLGFAASINIVFGETDPPLLRARFDFGKPFTMRGDILFGKS
jgi:hypothetical protein